MAYVINPNGKDVWLRDNADTMDISPTTDASSVYLENGRNVEQELSGTLKSEVVTVDSAMEKIVEGTLDGTYQECVLKGDTKWVDVDSGEILDEFIEGRNLELRGVESPSVTNSTEMKPIMDGLVCWLDGRDGQTGDNVWKDRSGNGSDVTLYNFQHNELSGWNKGGLVFDGVNNQCMSNLINNFNYKNLTYEINVEDIDWEHNANGDVNTRGYLICFANTSSIKWNGVRLSNAIGTPGVFITNFGKNNVSYSNFSTISNYQQNIENNKRILTVVANEESQSYFYDNGVQYSLSNLGGTDYGVNQFVLGCCRLNRNPYGKFRINSIKIYNRVLTEEEIQHNYLYEQSIERESKTKISTNPSQQRNSLTTPQDMTLHKVNNICDTYNAITGEYTQYIGERVYQVGDETDVDVITDMTKTLYVLDNPITTIVEPNIVPFAYENGSVSLDSANGILPTLEYATTISRMGQVSSNGLIIRKQEQQITNLEKMLIQGIVNMNYNNVLLNLDLKL